MNVLIATVTCGAGHLQAAAALEEAWRAFRPRDSVLRLDVLDFTPRLYRKGYIEGYVKLVEHAPELWGMIFDRTDKPARARRMMRLRRTLATLPTEKFTRELKRFAPDAVLCTHYMPLEIMGRLKAKMKSVEAVSTPRSSRREEAPFGTQKSEAGAAIPHSALRIPHSDDLQAASCNPPGAPFTVSVVTDFEAHALWMEPAVDLYCVAAEETKARLVARGAASENVLVTGIPIAAKFSAPVDAPATRKRLGLRDDLPVLLVLSGGFGMGPVRQILSELNKLATAVQVVVVCGRNEELRRELAVLERRHPTHVLGFVTNMHELMAAADLVLTKPGGLTSSEALALGKPMLVLNPIPGQEAANSDYLLEHGAAMKVSRTEDLPFRLEKLLGSTKLAEMARAAQTLGRSEAATMVCRGVAARVGG
ncbi:MAG: UDP-N-acetylglucosamine 2-epimerase [Verrucomicrobia bacterium]|nr:UDP-N-acetylglucosamine 2-epimerase [Verrucomicrobiota bacterium]